MVDQQGHHVAVPGAVVVLPGGLRLLPGTVGQEAQPGRAPLLPGGQLEAREAVDLSQPPDLVLRGPQREDLVVGGAGHRVGAGLLGVDLPEQHQNQGQQTPLRRAPLHGREVHADLGWVHDPGTALLGPERTVGADGGGLGGYPLEGEDLRLRAARRPLRGDGLWVGCPDRGEGLRVGGPDRGEGLRAGGPDRHSQAF